MKYFSTRNKNINVGFREAVLLGLAQDGGLFMPEYIPVDNEELVSNFRDMEFREIGYTIARKFITDEDIPARDLEQIINDAVSFPAPLIKLDDTYSVLELFHGPTLAFKDFAARFMARVMSYFVARENKTLNILVATSGDTGGAVAAGFSGAPNINVFVLYPYKKISDFQEEQINSFGDNIYPIAVKGTFDDCQKMVKQAFNDRALRKKIYMSSANSINISRLVPQVFYYFEAVKQTETEKEVIITVPSGNLGNLTAGLIAKRMGLGIHKFISALNSNDAFLKYLESGKTAAQETVETLSNAMDVGAPSNLERIIELYGEDYKAASGDILTASFNDEATLAKIEEVYDKYGYILDPHGAVGFLAAERFNNTFGNAHTNIIVETAHPVKFNDTIKKAVGRTADIPSHVPEPKGKGNRDVIENDYEAFVKILKNTSKIGK